MAGMPIPDMTRFNEMAIYPQLQDSLFFGVRMSLADEQQSMDGWDRGWLGLNYERSVASWNITAPGETYNDLKNGESLS